MASSKETDPEKSDLPSTIDALDSTARTNSNTTPLTPPAPAPPDGGTRAWLQVLGSFLVFFNLWGFVFGFGSFQAYYELDYLTGQRASTISWIGTVSTFLLIVTGVISGPLFDLGHFKLMLLSGALVEALSVFLLSICGPVYWQILLTQGVLMGLGNGLLYLPGLALVGRAFKKNRAIAMGITTCGAPVGGVIYTLVFEQLIDDMGFAWTVRIMGFIMLGTYAVSFPLLLWGASNLGDLASGTKRKLFDRSALSDGPFWTYSFSNFFIFMGYMVPFFYIATYGQTVLNMTRSTSLYIIMIAQASSVIGRLVAGLLASHIGVMIPWLACGSTSGIFCLAWIGARSQGSFIAFAALYGCFSGALIPLPPSVFPVVCPDQKVLGARLGMAQAIGSVASLVGSPIAGALVGIRGEGDFLGLQLFSGFVMLLGGCNLVWLWCMLVKRRGQGKLI